MAISKIIRTFATDLKINIIYSPFKLDLSIMKYLLFFANEENAYELNVCAYDNYEDAHKDYIDTLKYQFGDDVTYPADDTFCVGENPATYNVIIGLAEDGSKKAEYIQSYIEDCRQEVIDMFEEEDDYENGWD